MSSFPKKKLEVTVIAHLSYVSLGSMEMKWNEIESRELFTERKIVI